jgi:predicted RNase H-like HicB family nuclease
MRMLTLDFFRIPVVGKPVESDLHDFGAGTVDERYTGGRNLNMWVGGSCHTQHLEKSFSSRACHNVGFARGLPAFWSGVTVKTTHSAGLGTPQEAAAGRRIVHDSPAVCRFGLVYDYRRGRERKDGASMRSYTAIIERCPDTGLFVGYVPGLPGAHSQGETIDELNANLAEVIEMLLEDGEPAMESEFIGTQTVQVG